MSIWITKWSCIALNIQVEGWTFYFLGEFDHLFKITSFFFAPCASHSNYLKHISTLAIKQGGNWWTEAICWSDLKDFDNWFIFS